MVEKGEAELIRSPFHVLENDESRAVERREWVKACLNLASDSAHITAEMEQRADAFTKAGLKPLDAAHLAAAESANADFFITCDDQLIRKYRGGLRALTPPELILTLTKEKP
jgi:predicted nucleic acid-binding protein